MSVRNGGRDPRFWTRELQEAEGRLAVDRRFQTQSLGRALIRDAILRTAQAAEIAGIRAILVHAKDEDARNWYLRGFDLFLPSPTDSLTLILPLPEVTAALQSA